MLQTKSGLQAGPIICLSLHARRIERQMQAPNRLREGIFVIRRDRDFCSDSVRGESPFDLLLRRDMNCNVSFDHGLTGERVTLFDVNRGEAQGASAANASLHHLHRATSAASLPAARLTDVDAREVRGIRDRKSVV